MVGCQKTGEAIVIDAQRDIDVYLDIAKQNNLSITHIAEPIYTPTFFVVHVNWLQ